MSTSSLLGLLVLALLPAFCSAATVCEGGTATEEFTTQALTVVNERRSMLARQQQMNGNTSTNLPYGKNIRQLEWNCTLETSANGLMDGQCDHAGKTAPAGTSLIAFSDYLDSVGGTADISPILNSILMSIDHESLNVGTTTVTYTSTTGPNLANYANLARSDITSMACALETCGAGDEGRLAMYCLTDNTPLAEGGTVYEIAQAVCECDPGFTCDPNRGLCIASAAATTMATAATGAAATTTAAGGAGGAVFPTPNPGESTMCAQTAGTLTDALRIQFLDTHNVRRSQLALGKFLDGNAGALPPATDMTMLVWGCDLEQEATNYVRGCPTAASGTTTYGENFHRVSSANLQYYRDGVKDAVVAWWKVYRSYPVPRQMYMGASHGMVSSYSQMGWASTRRLGCSIGNCTGMYTIDCRYAPKGNIEGAMQYTSGTTCMSCPLGTACSPAMGLCV